MHAPLRVALIIPKTIPALPRQMSVPSTRPCQPPPKPHTWPHRRSGELVAWHPHSHLSHMVLKRGQHATQGVVLDCCDRSFQHCPGNCRQGMHAQHLGIVVSSVTRTATTPTLHTRHHSHAATSSSVAFSDTIESFSFRHDKTRAQHAHAPSPRGARGRRRSDARPPRPPSARGH